MKHIVLSFVALFLFVGVAQAQVPPVKNPTAISFNSVDHNVATVTGYEVDILNGTTVIQTINVPKADTTVLVGGAIRVTLNVQPITFGTNYRFVVRTVAGTIESVDSTPSDVWERVPGQPSKPVVQ